MNRFYSNIFLAAGILLAAPFFTSLPAVADEMVVYKVVDTQPSFPGGETAILQWLGKNVRYPVSAQENGEQGTVVVRAVITITGDVVNPVIEKSVSTALDNEALRVVQKMPMWQPGKSNGVPVNTYVTIPIKFRLTDSGDSAPSSAGSYSINNIKVGGDTAASRPAAKKETQRPAPGSFGIGNIKIGEGSKSSGGNTKSTYRPSLSSLFERVLNEYPEDVKLFENQALRDRLIALLGDLRFQFMVDNFDYEYPIERVRSAYSVMACKSGKCGITDFEIQYFPQTNNLCVKYNVDGNEEVFMEEKTYVKWTQYTDEEE